MEYTKPISLNRIFPALANSQFPKNLNVLLSEKWDNVRKPRLFYAFNQQFGFLKRIEIQLSGTIEFFIILV